MKFDKDIQRQAFAKRLMEAADAAGMSGYGMYSTFARHFKMSPTGVRKWFQADAVPYEMMDELASFLGVRAEWLRNGKGAMKEVVGIDPRGQEEKVEIHRVPILTAEEWRQYATQMELPDHLPTVLATGKLHPSSFAVQIQDNSLSDRVLSGMYVVISPAHEPERDDLVMAYVNGSFVGGTLVKRDTYVIIPPNHDYRPIDLGDNPTICGVMVAIAQQPL